MGPVPCSMLVKGMPPDDVEVLLPDSENKRLQNVLEFCMAKGSLQSHKNGSFAKFRSSFSLGMFMH